LYQKRKFSVSVLFASRPSIQIPHEKPLLPRSGPFSGESLPYLFLDYAAERLFLRKVGGGYSFIHRLLQDYFAVRYDDIIANGSEWARPSGAREAEAGGSELTAS
jgi:hypothetical protein